MRQIRSSECTSDRGVLRAGFASRGGCSSQPGGSADPSGACTRSEAEELGMTSTALRRAHFSRLQHGEHGVDTESTEKLHEPLRFHERSGSLVFSVLSVLSVSSRVREKVLEADFTSSRNATRGPSTPPATPFRRHANHAHFPSLDTCARCGDLPEVDMAASRMPCGR